MHGVSRHLFGDVGGNDVDLGVLPDERERVVEELLLHQHGARTMSRAQRSIQHLRGLRDVEAARGLGHPPQRHVGEVAVVGQARVVGGGEGDHGHRPTLPAPSGDGVRGRS